MANRYGLGSAEFVLTATNEPMLRAFAESEVKARQHSAKIAQAIKSAEGSSVGLATAFKGVGAASLALTAAIVGLQVSINGAVQVMGALTEASLRQKQVQFELTQTFKLSTGVYSQFAEQLAKSTNRTTTEVKASIIAFGVLQQNYALTSNQLKTLTTLTAAYSAKSGRDLEQSARDIQAAIRGEGEAVEKLGLTLGRDFVRNAGLMTEAQKKIFYTLSDSERAQIIYNAALKQGAEFSKTIDERRRSELGTFDEYNAKVKQLTETYGNLTTKGLMPVVKWANLVIGALEKLPATMEKNIAYLNFLTAAFLQNEAAANRARVALGQIPGSIQIGPDPGVGPPQISEAQIAATAEAIKNIQAQTKQAEDAIGTQIKHITAEIIKNNKERSEAVQRAIDFEIDEHNRSFEEQSAKTAKAKDLAIQAAEDAKEAQINAIEKEREAFNERHDEKMEQLRFERDAAYDAAEETRDNAIRIADVEEQAAISAAEETIRQAEIARDKRLQLAEDTRDGAIKALEEEKEVALQAIEDRIEAEQHAKTMALREAEDEKEGKLEKIAEEETRREKYYQSRLDNAERVKERELQAAEEEKDGKLAQLELEERARDSLRLTQDRAIEDGQKALQRTRQLEDRKVDIEEEALDRRRQLQDRAIDEAQEAEIRALDASEKEREDSYERQISDAKDANEEIIRALDRRSEQMERDHRDTLSYIEEEKRARLDEIEDRIRAVDALSKGFNNENKLTDLGQSLTIAQRKGDLTEIRRIEEQIRRERIAQAIDSAKDSLKIEKDFIGDQLDARKRQVEEEYRLRQQALKDEEQLAKDSLQQQLALIQQRGEEIKQSLTDEKAAIKERYETYQQALADQRYIEDQAHEAYLLQLEDQRAAEDNAFDVRLRQIEDQRKAEDIAAADRKKQVEEVYEQERDQVNETYERRADRLKEQERDEKETFDKRKKTVADAYDDEKRRLEDLYDDPRTGILARLRDARDLAQKEYKAKTDAINEAYDNEKRQIKETYDDEATGLIPAMRRMIEKTRTEYDERRRIAEEVYKDEKDRIKDLYDGPEGLIKKQEDAKKAALKEFAERQAAAQATYDAEKRNIYNVYDDPVSGLIARQAKAHKDAIDNLNNQKTAWQNWETDTKRNIEAVMDGPLKTFTEKLDELERRGFIVPGAVDRNRTSDRPPGDGPGGGVGQNVAGTKYNTLFGFDQPYNGPYGGAMWPGGPTRHRGIDLTLPGPNHGKGSPIGAFRNGRVENTTNEDAGGRGFIVRGEDGLFEYYGHMDNVNVSAGDEIRRGQIVGTLGSTGLEPWQTPHLHYEVRARPGGDPPGRTIDPVPYMGGFYNPAGGNAEFSGDVIELRPFGPNGAVVVIRARAQDWRSKAEQIAREENFSDPDLFGRQMRHESDNFAPDVVRGERPSPAGARGIAQFMPDTARALGVNVYDPIDSLTKAARYMHQMEMRYNGLHGNRGVTNALWGYNAGEGNLQQGIMPGETRRYLEILQGYANGKMIMEPTLMVGLRSGEMGIAGETGQPERLLGTSATASYDNGGGTQQIHIPVIIGDDTIQYIIIEGHKLVAKSGRNVNVPGLTTE